MADGPRHRHQSGNNIHIPWRYIAAADPVDADTIAYDLWLDTSGGTGAWATKVRNAANSGWETVSGGGGTGATEFTDLTDVPSAYTGASLQGVRVNATEDGLEFYVPSVGGAEAFTDLSDAPANYTGYAHYLVRVNATEDGLEFVVSSGGVSLGSGYRIPYVNGTGTDLDYIDDIQIDPGSGTGTVVAKLNQILVGAIAGSYGLHFGDTTSKRIKIRANGIVDDQWITLPPNKPTAVGQAMVIDTLASTNQVIALKWDAPTPGGLGSAAAENVGTSAGDVVQLDGSAKLPAVDGSQLTNLPSTGGATADPGRIAFDPTAARAFGLTPRNGRLGEFPSISSPRQMIVNAGILWVATGSYTVKKIDLATTTVLATISLGADVGGLCTDGTDIFVTVGRTDTPFYLKKIDGTSNAVTSLHTFSVGYGYAVFYAAGALWVTGWEKIYKCDPATGNILYTLTIANDFARCFGYDGVNLWAASAMSGSNCYIIETATATLVTTVSGSSSVDVASLTFDGDHMYASGAGHLYAFRVTDYTQDFTVDISGLTYAAFDGLYVWCSYDSGTGYLTRVDIRLRTQDYSFTIPFSGTSGSGPLVFDGTHMWAADNTANIVRRYPTR